MCLQNAVQEWARFSCEKLGKKEAKLRTGAEAESRALILRRSRACNFGLLRFLANGKLARWEVNKIMAVVKRHNYFMSGFTCSSLPAKHSYKPRRKKKRKKGETVLLLRDFNHSFYREFNLV